MSEDVEKAENLFVFRLNIVKEVARWFRQLDERVQEDWISLMVEFKKKYPDEREEFVQKKCTNKTYAQSQRGRPIAEYLKEADELARIAPKNREYHGKLADKFLQGLIDQAVATQVKMTVRIARPASDEAH